MRKISFILVIAIILSTLVTIPAAAEGENIALGASVTASTMYSQTLGGPEGITDGDYQSFWARGSITLEGKNDNRDWVMIDLAQEAMVEEVVVHIGLNDSMAYANRILVELSSTADFSENVKAVVATEGEVTEVSKTWLAKFKGDSAYRYVRVMKSDIYYFQVSEVEVFAKPAPPDPSKAIYSDVENTEYESAIKLLQRLGVNIAAGATEYGVNNLMTRGLAVSAVVKAFYGDMEVAEDLQNSFMDVEKDHPMYKEIALAKMMGLVSGDENGMFKPDSYITSGEMLMILFRALGYREVLESYPNQTAEAVKLASRLEITSRNVVPDSHVSYAESLLMIYNALLAHPYQKFEEKIIKDGTSYLEEKYGLKIYRGYVTETRKTSLSSLKTSIDNRVVVGDAEIRDDEGKADGLIGCCVDVCVDKDKKIFSISAVQNKIITFSSDDIKKSPTNNDLYYEIYNGDKTVKYKVEQGFDIVLNDSAIFNFSYDVLQPKNGSIKLIDNNNDSVYDVIIIDSYEIAEVELISSDNNTTNIVGKASDSTSIKYACKTESLTVFNENMRSMEVGQIKPKSTIKIYKNDETGFTKIVLMSAKISGKVDSISNDYILIGGETYNISGCCEKSEEIYASSSVSLFFDERNNVIFIKKGVDTENWKIAFVIDYAETGVLTPEYTFKVFTEDNAILKYRIADRVQVDGNSYDMDRFKTYMMNQAGQENIRNAFIRFRLNNNADIAEIDTKICTANENPNESMGNPILIDEENVYDSAAECFYKVAECNAWVPNNIFAFNIPKINGTEFVTDSRYDKYYNVGNVTSIVPNKDKAGKTVECYMPDEYGMVRFIVGYESVPDVVDSDLSPEIDNSNSSFMVISNTGKTVDDEGVEVSKIEGYDLLTKKKTEIVIQGDIKNLAYVGLLFQRDDVDLYFTNADDSRWNGKLPDISDNYKIATDSLKCGDIIRYQMDVDNTASRIEVVYLYDKNSKIELLQKNLVWYAVNSNFNLRFHHFVRNRFQTGTKINTVNGKVVKFNTPLISEEKPEIYSMADVGKVLIYDSARKNIFVEDGNILLDYADSDKYNFVIYCNAGKVKSVIIYPYN